MNSFISHKGERESYYSWTLVSEFTDLGDLFTYFSGNERYHGQEEVSLESLRFSKQLVDDVVFLHEKKMLHLDIKPENILVFEKKKENGKSERYLRFIDFGSSGGVDEICKSLREEKNMVLPGTLEYYSPMAAFIYQETEKKYMKPNKHQSIFQIYSQTLKENIHDDEEIKIFLGNMDLWSLGVTMYYTNFNELPYWYKNGEMIEILSDLKKMKIKDLENSLSKDLFWWKDTASGLSEIEKMIVSILTQSTVSKYISRKIDLLKRFSKTLDELILKKSL